MTFLDRFGELLGRPRKDSRVEVIPDFVWMSSDAKTKAIRKHVSSRRGDQLIGLVAHFPNVLEELQRIAGECDAPSVKAFLARELSPEAAVRLPLGASDTVDLLVAERHPLPSADAALLQFAEALPCRCRVEYHVALDDPLMLQFGADSIRRVMSKLGSEEDEEISHPLITRSIQRAQSKIEKESIGNHDADSAAEWLERNTRRTDGRLS
jgi:hypothetical protein